MSVEELGGEIQCRRATDLKSEYERQSDRYASGMTRSLGLFYGLMMSGIGLDMLGVRCALIICGALAGLSFLALCFYSRRMNALIQQDKKD